MTTLAISDDLNAVLEEAANRSGISKGEFLEDLIRATADDESLPLSAFTDKQLTRLKQGMAQVNSGTCSITSEEVDAKFARFFAELEAR